MASGHSGLLDITTDHCSYLPMETQTTKNVVIPDGDPVTMARLAERELKSGSHYRSGRSFEKLSCDFCRACLPIRYPVLDFRLSPSQRALKSLMPDSRSKIHEGQMRDLDQRAHFNLAARYNATRFPVDEKYNPIGERLDRLINRPQKLPIKLLELVDQNQQLVGASVMMLAQRSLYGIVYYYDTDRMDLQPGKQLFFASMDYADKIGATHFYVGAWNPHNKSLASKVQFRPYELMTAPRRWTRFDTAHPKLDV